MVIDGARAEQQTGRDLPIGRPVGGHPSHRQLLSGEQGGQVAVPARRLGGLTQSTEFTPGLRGTVRRTEVLERFERAVQPVTRLRTVALPS